MEAYRTQNRFLNSEIHQVTKIWRKVAEKEKALLMKVRAEPRSGHLSLQPPFQSTHPLTTVSLSPLDPTAHPPDCALRELYPHVRDLCSADCCF